MTGLEISDLVVRRSGRAVLRGGTVTVSAPGVALCTGPNGSGKTTLLEALAGILSADGGAVTCGGLTAELSSDSWRDSVSYLPSDGGTIPLLTAAEQLRLVLELHGVGRHESQSRIERLSEIYQLIDFLHVRADALSTGMRKRLGIAIAVAAPADVYLLDEPAAGLDAHGVSVLRATISVLRDTGRVVIATTNAPEAFPDLADTWWRLEKTSEGAVIAARLSAVYADAGPVSGDDFRDQGATIGAGVELPWLLQK